MQADTLFSGSVVRDTVITAEGALPRTAADTVNVSLAEATGEAVSTVQGFVDTFFASLPRVAVGIVVLLFFWLVAKGVRSAIHRITPGPIDSPIGMVLGRVATAFLLVLGVLVGLVVVFPTFTVTGLVGALGVGGVVIGFAFQDTFQNLNRMNMLLLI